MGTIAQYNSSENVISGRYLGDEGPVLIELVRNGEVIDDNREDGPFVEFTFEDHAKSRQVCLKPRGYKPFVYYYIRASQGQHRMTWGSPVWLEQK